MKALGWLSIALVSFSVYAADRAITRPAFTVIAHRGNHTRAHENTITALRHALEAGVDYAEIDVRRTSDDHYVLMHDSTVDRMTDGHGAVANLTLAELKALHVRDQKRPEISPDRIATLDDALSLVKSGLKLYLDFKAGDRTQVAKAIRDAAAERQVLVYDSAEAVAQWRRVGLCFFERTLLVNIRERKRATRRCDFQTCGVLAGEGRRVLRATDPMLCRALP